MDNLILFANGFASYFVTFIVFIVVILIAIFIGISIRKSKNNKIAAETVTENAAASSSDKE